MTKTSDKKKLTRGEKWLLVAPLFFAALFFGVVWFRNKTKPIVPRLTLYQAAEISSALLTPDGKTLIVAVDARTGSATSGQVRLYNARTGTFIKTLVVSYAEVVAAIAISHDGQFLACGLTRNTTAIWRLKDLKKVHILKHGEVRGMKYVAASSLDFSPDNRMLAVTSIGVNTPVLLWNLKTEKFIGALGRIGRNASKIRYVHRLVKFSPDGKFLACYAYAKTDGQGKWSAFSIDVGNQLWDVYTGKFLRNVPGNMPFTFSPDSKAIAVNKYIMSSGTIVDLIDVKSGQSSWQNSLLAPIFYNVPVDLAFSPDGKYIACARESGDTINILNRFNGETIAQLKPVMALYGSNSRPPSFSNDGKTLLTLSYDTVFLWNTDDWNTQ